MVRAYSYPQRATAMVVVRPVLQTVRATTGRVRSPQATRIKRTICALGQTSCLGGNLLGVGDTPSVQYAPRFYLFKYLLVWTNFAELDNRFYQLGKDIKIYRTYLNYIRKEK